MLPEVRPCEGRSPAEFRSCGRLPGVPDWLQASRALAGLTAAVGFCFIILSRRPLWHTDLWGHLAYGRLIWNSGRLPETEPLMPLAAGTPLVDSAWLSQIVGYLTYSQTGVAGLQFLYAAAIAFCLALLAYRGYARTGNAWIVLAGLALFAGVSRLQLLVIRPQLGGLACFVLLLTVLTGSRGTARRRADWFAVPAVFALWANLHGSFPVGLALLACLCLGRAGDVLRRTGGIARPGRSFETNGGSLLRGLRWAAAGIVRDSRVRRYCLLTVLAAAAVLINPYGWRLYAEVLTFAGHPNLASLREWDPLTLRTRQGQAAAAAALLLMVVYRLTPRRISFAEVLLVAGLGAAALWTSRMIVWWAPVAAYSAMLHAGAVWQRRRPLRSVRQPSPRQARWAVVTAGLIAVSAFASPLGVSVLPGRPPDFRASVSAQTPVGAVDYLAAHPPAGQVFNTYEWGDYLLWAGPSGVQVFVASHAHLVPRGVWLDYLRIITRTGDWEAILDRYEVHTVLIDYRYRRGLIRSLKNNGRWQVLYEDKISVVFGRIGR